MQKQAFSLWGRGDRDYDVFVQRAQVHYSLANQFRSANQNQCDR